MKYYFLFPLRLYIIHFIVEPTQSKFFSHFGFFMPDNSSKEKEKNKEGRPIPSCWILVESGLRGTENQCLGVAEALGVHAEIKNIALNPPWKQLSPWFRFMPTLAISPSSSPIRPPFPDIIIAAGRKAALPAMMIKKQSNGKTFTIFLQDPKIKPENFDLVIAPRHDNVEADNVLSLKAGLHNISPEKLEKGREETEEYYKHLPSPRIGVLIGGTSKTHKLTPPRCLQIAQQIFTLAEKGYGVMVTASRRTGMKNREILNQILNISRVHLWDGTGINPYHGILAWADILLVTEDSVSMTSEAVSTGKPVYVIKLQGGSARFERFHKGLQDDGYTREFHGDVEEWSYTPPDDMQQVTKRVRRMIGKKFKIG